MSLKDLLDLCLNQLHFLFPHSPLPMLFMPPAFPGAYDLDSKTPLGSPQNLVRPRIRPLTKKAKRTPKNDLWTNSGRDRHFTDILHVP